MTIDSIKNSEIVASPLLLDMADYQEAENRQCFWVYEKLLFLFQECEKKAAPFRNLVAVFFPDLMRILTGYTTKALEMEARHFSKEDCQQVPPLKEYPFFGVREIASGEKSATDFSYERENAEVSLKMKGWNFAGKWQRKKKTIGIAGTGPLRRELVPDLLSAGYASHFPEDCRIFIPQFEAQFEILQTGLDRLFQELQLFGAFPAMAAILKQFFSLHLLPQERNKFPFDFLITGTQEVTRTRLIAAQAKAQGIPVLTLCHGEGNYLIFDEPRIGYGDMTFTDFLLVYGREAARPLQEASYLQGLYGEPEIFGSDSDLCRKFYDPLKKIQSFSYEKRPLRLLYVPTNVLGVRRYGPFHSLPDTFYLGWQKVVHQLFPEAIYKAHPKNAFSPELPFSKKEMRPFDSVLQEADGFIFDYIATAFNLAAATDKPILYFDLGIRNISASAMKAIKERTCYVDVSTGWNPEILKKELLKDGGAEKQDTYTPQYCLLEKKEARKETVLRLIDQVLKES